GKRQKINDFFKTLSKDDVEKRIRPFIEKQLITVIDKIKKSGTPLYFKKDKFSVLYPEDTVKINEEPAKTVFNIEKNENGTKYYLSVKHGGNIVNLFGKAGIVLANEPCMLVLKNNLYFFDDIDGKKLLPFFDKKQLLIPAGSEKKWFEVFAVKAMKKYHVKPKGFTVTEIKEDFKARVSLEKDWKGEYAFLMYFKYESGEYRYGLTAEPKLIFNEKDFSFVKVLRNKEKENEFAEKLKKAGLKEHDNGVFKIKYFGKNTEKQKHETILWLKDNKHFFEENDIKVEQNFYGKKYFTEKTSLNLRSEISKDWFDIYGTVMFGSFEIPFTELKNNILNEIKEFILPDGSTALIPDEWFSKYSDLFMFGKAETEVLKVSKTHFTVLENVPAEGIDKDFKKNISKLSDYKNYKIEIPENIKAELRPYQKEGFKIMSFWRDNYFGGCLADDMGLGKTLQTITLLQDTVNKRKKDKKNYTEKKDESNIQLSLFAENNEDKKYVKKASLIVMPVSLIHNWKNEINKFAPELKVLSYRGAGRQKYISKFDDYDIILAGYASVRNDIEQISEYEFLYVVLDESQFVKNPESKTYKAVTDLQSEYKLILTGTPVENSLSDLWAQMNFINEGMLGDKTFFRHTFLKPIEKDKDELSERKLQKITAPFILRRTKDEVAKDLPPLSEQIILCVPDEEQKRIYEEEKSKIRNTVFELMETGERKSLAMHVLSALTRLRQIANHPVLADSGYQGKSGKFEEVVRNAENVIAEGHKVLIFSSFVKHLELFADYFKKKNIRYSMLTGQTKKREKVISGFRNDIDNKIFLISVKAGGTGLNLIEADYVFILDPWWNPAAEKQAVNRAHRIGQDKNVMVYKYISEDTVEEKILRLQQKKSDLAKIITAGKNPLSEMSEKMIEELFE
ncbi:MAG: DEAD/DEAH box helicase, partial [Chlorobi bacterium]|nr:DEAD/DEAH box helicase [Chlorobiota bacterium]